jgi:hypothetical protein
MPTFLLRRQIKQISPFSQREREREREREAPINIGVCGV